MEEKQKLELEKIIKKIREFEQRENNIETLFGFGMLKIIYPKIYKTPITNNEKDKEYTDNGLAGEWFNYGVNIKEKLNFIYSKKKIYDNID